MFDKLVALVAPSFGSISDDIRSRIMYGRTPSVHPESGRFMPHHILMSESRQGVEDKMQALRIYFDAGGRSSIDTVDEKSGLSALGFAISNGCHEALIWVLLENRVQCNFPGRDGLTPLQILERVEKSFCYSDDLKKVLSTTSRYEMEEGSTRMSDYFLYTRGDGARRDFKVDVIDSVEKFYERLAIQSERASPLKGYKIDLRVPVFKQVQQLPEADLSYADLRKIDFTHVDLSGADFTSSDLRGAMFSSSCLLGVNFTGADLRDVVFSGASLCGANFTDADLTGVDLSGRDLRGTTFCRTKLKKANLLSANLTDARFTGVDLTRVTCSLDQFESAHFANVVFLHIETVSRTDDGRIEYHSSGNKVIPDYFFGRFASPAKVGSLSRSGSGFDSDSPLSEERIKKRYFESEKKRREGAKCLHDLIDDEITKVDTDIKKIQNILSHYHNIADIRESCVGASSDAVDDISATALYKAVSSGKADIAEILLDAGANPNLACGDDRETPLFAAVLNGNIDCIRLLCVRGAYLDFKNARGETPESVAESCGRCDCIAVLKEMSRLRRDELSRSGSEQFAASVTHIQPLIRRRLTSSFESGFSQID